MNDRTSVEGLNNSPSPSDLSESQFSAPDSVFSGSLFALARALGATLDDAFDSDEPSAALVACLPSPPLPLATPGSNTGVNHQIGRARGEKVVKIDTCTFSFPGHKFDGSIKAAGKWLRRWTCGALAVGGELGKHYNGYAKCYGLVLADGTPAPNLGWLGVSAASDNMRGRWCIHLTGVACGVLNSIEKQMPGEISVFMGKSGRYESKPVSGPVMSPWDFLAEDFADYGIRLTRVDLAVDDLEGEHSVGLAVRMYEEGYFSGCNGRPPKNKHITTSHGGGDTFYVGKACSGKMLRVYDKGKELGCPESLWVRWEVQLLAINRNLPVSVLIRPQNFMRGAYPRALEWIGAAASYIATKVERGRLLCERAVKFAKQQVGSLMSYLREQKCMDDGAIVGELIGCPGRYPMRLFEYELPDGPWESPFNADDSRGRLLVAAAALGIDV